MCMRCIGNAEGGCANEECGAKLLDIVYKEEGTGGDRAVAGIRAICECSSTGEFSVDVCNWCTAS